MTTLTTIDRELATKLSDAALSQRSGLLTAARGKLKRVFCLQSGMLAFGLSNVIEEQFAATAVENGFLRPGDVDATVPVAKERGIGLTRLLLEEKLVEPSALLPALSLHVRRLLYSTLDWSHGECSFDVGVPKLDGEVTVELSCIDLLLDYAADHPENLDEVRIRVGSPSARPLLVDERIALVEQRPPDPAMAYLLERCDGVVPLSTLVRDSPWGQERTWRCLYAMILIGAVESDLAGKPADGEVAVTREELLARIESVQGADYYAVLELNAACSADQIRSAYYFLARRYHPDRFRTGRLRDMRGEIEHYFAKVTEAYNTLFDPRLREDYDEQREAKQGPQRESAHMAADLARQNYARARLLIDKGRFTDAVTSLQNAIDLDDREPVYHLELGRLLSRNPRMRREAEEHLIETNRIDPTLTDGYMALGRFYVKNDRKEDAIRLFREVLRWEPGHLEATEELQALGQRATG